MESITERLGHLDRAPRGVDSVYAWHYPGGNGAGVNIAVIDQAWQAAHFDLPNIQPVPGVGVNMPLSRRHLDHGTAVLGILSATHNGVGASGMVPHAAVRPASSWTVLARNGVQVAPEEDLAGIIGRVSQTLRAGDVLLIERSPAPATGKDPNLPVEVDPGVRAAIQRATRGRKIVVIEPAGNGGYDLDDPVHDARLSPTNPDYEDSGAILVAGAESADGHQRHPTSNHGDRVDCFAWGEHIRTLTSAGGILDDFGGTSGAAAIIAGVAASVQGIARNTLGRPFSPREMRALFRDPDYGTRSTGPERIGLMPDLRKIIDHRLKPAPLVPGQKG